MSNTLSIPLSIDDEIHAIEGGGYWAEVSRFPGIVAQGETLEVLKGNLILAIHDWLDDSSAKTENEARQLAEIQGSQKLADEVYPFAYDYQPPAGWSDEDPRRASPALRVLTSG